MANAKSCAGCLALSERVSDLERTVIALKEGVMAGVMRGPNRRAYRMEWLTWCLLTGRVTVDAMNAHFNSAKRGTLVRWLHRQAQAGVCRVEGERFCRHTYVFDGGLQ